MTRLALAIVTSVILTGCAPRTNLFEVVNYRDSGETERFQQPFDACYYTVHADGNLEIVARRHSRALGEQREDVTQVIHIRTLFRAVPGRTHVERSMINASVTYAIIGGAGGACYEGGGFLTGAEKEGDTVLIGELEDSKLHPGRSVGDVPSVFDRAVLVGEFTAKRDRGKVISMLNELDRLFGPRPRYEPPPSTP